MKKTPQGIRPHSGLLTACLFVLLLAGVASLAAATPTPGAGSILQQIPVRSPAPSAADTGLKIEPSGKAAIPASAPFLVKHVKITGNTVFDTATLHALVKDQEGEKLTLAQLNDLTLRITDYYHRHDYPLARAIIPAETIREGVVTFDIIEARYGKVSLDNHSRASTRLLRATLSPLKSGNDIRQSSLDHSLLLLSDIPGITVSGTLKPGQAVGTSDLQVATRQDQTIAGNIVLNNDGSRYTGRARAGGNVTFIGPFHHGDILDLTGLTSGTGLSYGGIRYSTLLNRYGTRLGTSYSALHYSIGDNFADLNARGTAEVASLWLQQPLVRRRNINVYGKVRFDYKRLKDDVEAGNIHTDRHLDNWTASLTGDQRDSLLSGGLNTWRATVTSGRVSFDDTAAGQADAATARTRGRFIKWTVDLTRLQRLTNRDSLYVALSGQWANSNLDAAEQMLAGGPYTVRAYDMGILSGDTGYLGTTEFRHDLGRYWQGQWQVVAFFDSEHLRINKDQWTSGDNSITLSGVGIGLNWAGPDRWAGHLYIAKPIGSVPSTISTGNPMRCWIQLSKNF